VKAKSSANWVLVFGSRCSAHKTWADLTIDTPACLSALLTKEFLSVKRVRSGSGRGLWKRSGLGV
jgi:hypothetical protein